MTTKNICMACKRDMRLHVPCSHVMPCCPNRCPDSLEGRIIADVETWSKRLHARESDRDVWAKAAVRALVDGRSAPEFPGRGHVGERRLDTVARMVLDRYRDELARLQALVDQAEFRCRNCGSADGPPNHVRGEKKCCPDCDHRPVT